MCKVLDTFAYMYAFWNALSFSPFYFYVCLGTSTYTSCLQCNILLGLKWRHMRNLYYLPLCPWLDLYVDRCQVGRLFVSGRGCCGLRPRKMTQSSPSVLFINSAGRAHSIILLYQLFSCALSTDTLGKLGGPGTWIIVVETWTPPLSHLQSFF